MIAIGVEALLQRDEASGRPIVFQTDDQEELRECADVAVKQLAEEGRVELERIFTKDESLIGVIFCGVITAWSAKPSAYLYNWVHHTVANERLDLAARPN